MKRLFGIIAGAIIGMGAVNLAAAQGNKELIIAEPVHAVGYLPIYVAVHQGFFAKEKLSVKVVTIESPAGHANAVIAKQAFACVGGPEYNAFVNSKGGDLRAIANVIDRGDVYFIAKKGMEPKDKNYKAYLKGKTIALPYYGSTPNSILRYVVNNKWGVDLKSDVTLIELANYTSILAALKAGQAQVGVMREPVLTQGKNQGLWDEAFYSVPLELGPYTYSAISVSQETIKNDPETVKSFVRGLANAQKFIYANPAEAAAIAKKEFPTMAPDDLKATLDRAIDHQIWSKDGMISKESWNTAKAVVMETNVLKSDVPYDAIIDMSFVEAVRGAN